MPETLNVAVCICTGVTLSDFIPNIEILAELNDADDPVFSKLQGIVDVPFRVKFEYLSPTLDPVVSLRGKCAPTFNPTTTYAAAKASGTQYDIIFVPAGEPSVPEDLIAFICTQRPRFALRQEGDDEQGILSHYRGVFSSVQGIKFDLTHGFIEAATPKDIKWVTKARWAVDGNIWTSSGVAAGYDMVLAFIEHLVGPPTARVLRDAAEIRDATQEDDPFAEFHGLV
ncbi:hypothetical protein DFH08DRAFT_807417 [Mycena albidolilacea]|uniref:DJ-1/PfpI domain-containing protein n=1 Tax=Mycena albidolilacea TaxID=1033008 RepID=A0AAD7A4E5_9AGAR|nr:hypothetical protein DFH08DRAFT_807417 [Mycena albidolilacea]